jgi:CHAT domain
MGKVVVLKIETGDFDCGFKVFLAIGEDGIHHFAETKGQLPPAPDMIRHYTDWQSTYRRIVDPLGPRLGAKEGQPTNPEDLLKQNTKASEQLENSVNQWLNSGEFSSIREKLKQALNTEDDVRFIVQTDDSNLQRLPWHLWTLWEDYHRSEIAFSLSSYQRLAKQAANQPKEQVRILAVFGGNSPINFLQLNLEEDWKTLQNNFPDAEIIRLNQPTLEYLGNRIWNDQFDIIFYSGHSYSEKDSTKNWLVINEQENIEIRSLKFAFQRAVRRGLHLVIFNSCDGLGIGQQLASWCIPQVIVMREIVSDDVAQKFLQYFLESYAHQEEKPFYLAVREAREKLSFLERQCPGATWLPVIFQNPSEVPLSWQQLCNVRANRRKQETSVLANNSDRISSTRQVPEKFPINIQI